MQYISTEQAIRDLDRYFQGLNTQQVTVAISRSLNRAIITARSESSKEIRKVYNMQAAAVNKQMNIKRSSPRTLTANINAVSAYTPLSAFNPRFVSSQGVATKRSKGAYSSRKLKRVRKGSTGVTVEILKGQRKRLPSAFLVNARGNMVVMARGQYSPSNDFTWRNKRTAKTGNDTPIDGLKTVSVYKSVIHSAVQVKVDAAAQDTFTRRILHELSQGIGHGRASSR